MIHLPTPTLRLAPLPFPSLSFFSFVFFFLHSLLKQFPRGLEHPEASFVPTIHRFALAHAVDFGGNRSVDDGKRRSATLLARTCSGFYVSLIALSHLAVIAALRRIGFPLLSLIFSLGMAHFLLEILQNPLASTRVLRAELHHRFQLVQLSLCDSSRFLSPTDPLLVVIPLDHKRHRVSTSLHSPHRLHVLSTVIHHRIGRQSVASRSSALLSLTSLLLSRLPGNNYTATAGDSSAPPAAHRSALHPFPLSHFVNPHSERDRRDDHAAAILRPALQRLLLLLPLFLTPFPFTQRSASRDTPPSRSLSRTETRADAPPRPSSALPSTLAPIHTVNDHRFPAMRRQEFHHVLVLVDVLRSDHLSLISPFLSNRIENVRTVERLRDRFGRGNLQLHLHVLHDRLDYKRFPRLPPSLWRTAP